LHSLKSYTANKVNQLLHRSGQFWQHESYDHWVRDDDELQRIVDYISWNPVKAQLVEQPHDWYFSSAHHRLLHAASRSACLGPPAERQAALLVAGQPTSWQLVATIRGDKQPCLSLCRGRRFRLGHFPNVLCDSHRAELRPAHRAELRRLEHLLRQRFIVHRP